MRNATNLLKKFFADYSTVEIFTLSYKEDFIIIHVYCNKK